MRITKENLQTGDLENEYWVDISEIVNGYHLSNLGRIKSLVKKYRRNEIILTPSPDKDGYIVYRLSPKTVKIHILIATYFIPNPENKPEVNHKNYIKSDNRIDNLEWATRKENMNHALENNLLPNGEKNGRSKLRNNDVLEILKSNVSIKELTKKYKITEDIIYKIKRGVIWKSVTMPVQ